MPFSYHPPTRQHCDTCSKFNGDLKPVIDTHNGKASSADNFPFHNWYNFVLGYTPEFPDYILKRECADNNCVVMDPFMGSGTTLACCKNKGIESFGIDANDFFKFAADTKLNWKLNLEQVKKIRELLLHNIKEDCSRYKWPEVGKINTLFEVNGTKDYINFAKTNRPEALIDKYVSDAPFAKLTIIKDQLEKVKWPNNDIRNLFYLAFATIIVPSSNVRYGPGFGVIKPKLDIDVVRLYEEKIDRMISDLSSLSDKQKNTESHTFLGDARLMSNYVKPNSIDLMITSPPYPGDHEYTKYSKLELILMNYAQSLSEFRTIKKRMLRCSTTNIYKEDHEGDKIRDIESIKVVAEEIDRRIKEDNGTSGFEKLYSKLVWEYFGGMYLVFEEALKVLKPGGKFMLLVSDSHAFKMVHIETAKLLEEVAKKAGFVNGDIELWQYKNSTSHKYKLLENTLTIQKPF